MKETGEMQGGRGVEGRGNARVCLSVSPFADFREIIRTLDSIDLPRTCVSSNNIRFAILELLSNSIRAHREHNVDKEIRLELAVTDGTLFVSIRDFGGGFDPGALPYDLEADPKTLNLQSPPFEEYQTRHSFKRFGMGIYVAKKTFERVKIDFFDEQENLTPWKQGKIAGTLITLSIPAEAADGT